MVSLLLLTVLLTLIRQDALIKKNRPITIIELAESLKVNAEIAVTIMNTLGYSKVCARSVPRQLTEAHKHSRLKTCSKLLEYFHSDKIFLQQIVTGMRLGFTTSNQSQREHQWSGAIPPHYARRSSNLNSLQEK